MRFQGKDFEIPQVCLDLGFEDMSRSKERAARMYNPQLDLTLFVNPNGRERRYVLRDCSDHGLIGFCETDGELKQLVTSAHALTRRGVEADA